MIMGRARLYRWSDKWKRGILVVAMPPFGPTLGTGFEFHQIITNASIMLKITLLTTLGAVVTSAQLLDIPGLLGGLGPAPDNDPRFTTFTPPGHNDGKPAIIPSDLTCGESILIHHVVRSPCPGLVSYCSMGSQHTITNGHAIEHFGKPWVHSSRWTKHDCSPSSRGTCSWTQRGCGLLSRST